jgi:DNA-binding NtrC family response regulator
MLQERRIRAVGSLTETEVDVRVVAATNVPLDQAVREGSFREDLFYRLDVIRISVPPLRERPEDILFLFGHFTKRFSKHYGTDPLSYGASFVEALTRYEWPGNVRQLQNLSERLVLSRPRRLLTARDFAKLLSSRVASTTRPKATSHEAVAPRRVDTSRSLEENVSAAIASLEQEYLTDVLRQSSGAVGRAADQAGISRRTLLRKMKAYNIDKDAFKPE